MSGLRFDFYVLVSQTVSYPLLDAFRKHKAPGSETKDVIAHIPANNGSMFACVSLPSKSCGGDAEGPGGCLHLLWVVLQENCFGASSKPAVWPGGR